MYVQYASDLLKHFILNCVKLYDAGFISLNVHSLLHLTDMVKLFGPLDNTSCFSFENYMTQLKKKVRKSAQPLQQVIRRTLEEKYGVNNYNITATSVKFSVEHNDGPLWFGYTSPQYKKLITNLYTVNINKLADSFVELNDSVILKVVNFAYSTSHNEKHVLGYIYERVKPMFNKPCPSSFIGIDCIKGTNDLFSCSITNIKRKVVILPFRSNFVALPMLHV